MTSVGSVDTTGASPEVEELHQRIDALRADLALVDRQLRDAARTRPLLTLGIALAIGFALGRAVGRA
jgi:hypothetical protein